MIMRKLVNFLNAVGHRAEDISYNWINEEKSIHFARYLSIAGKERRDRKGEEERD